MKSICFFLVMAALSATNVLADQVLNGAFTITGISVPSQELYQDVLKAKWSVPSREQLPDYWGPNPSMPGGMKTFRTGGRGDSSYVQLDKGGHLISYFGKPDNKPYVMSVWIRGQGKLTAGAYQYGSADCAMQQVVLAVKAAATQWVQYRGLWYPDPNRINSILFFIAADGPLDVDDFRFDPAGNDEIAIVKELYSLYGSGVLAEGEIDIVAVDDNVKQRGKTLAEVLQAASDTGNMDSALIPMMTQRSQALISMAEGGTAMSASDYNEMIALTSLFAKAAHKQIDLGQAIVQKAKPTPLHRSGIRLPRENTITITKIRSNKILYAQGEDATAVVTLVNQTSSDQTGELVCQQRWDIDGKQELGRYTITIPANGTYDHTVAFNVGPEMFGREFHAEFIQDGKTIDSWSEFYSAADEWMRVHIRTGMVGWTQHDITTFGTYVNLAHYFCTMPSDFGYGAPKENRWLTGQGSVPTSKQGQISDNQRWHQMGVKVTYYVNPCFSGQAGYEIMRRHPEWNLYDKKGFPQIDAVYGGFPNPLELASPIEIDPAIADPNARKITSWYHGTVNFANFEAVKYGTQEIINSIDMFDWDGVFWDGCWTVRPGYDVTGQINCPPEQVDGGSIRNFQYITSELLKRKSHFATWYNWAHNVSEATTFYYGYTWGDEQFATVASVPNSCMLLECTTQINPKTHFGQWRHHYEHLLKNRDWCVQKHGSIQDIGFLTWPAPEADPTPKRWGWVFYNHLGAQLIATQMHPVCDFNPAWRPTLQFMTRYSSLFWDREIKVAPDPQTFIDVSADRNVWWKDIVYTRTTDKGTDYIVHLLNEPQTATTQIDLPTDPPKVRGATVSILLSGGREVISAWALRPYDFEEAQRPRQEPLNPRIEGEGVEVTVPEFRYHCMVVLRIGKERAGKEISSVGSRDQGF